jgi:hypothetical protein
MGAEFKVVNVTEGGKTSQRVQLYDGNNAIGNILPANISPTLVGALNTELGKNLTFTNGNVRASADAAVQYAPGVAASGSSGSSSSSSSSSSSGSGQTTGQNRGAAAILGGPESNADFSVEDYNALTTRMTLLYNAAAAYAKMYGFLVSPRVDPVTGNVTGYDPILDNDGKQIPTQESIKQKYDVEKLITDNEVARAGVTGKIKDPTDPTGERWINTPASMLQLAQANQANAAADETRNDIRVKNQELLSAALADPNRFVEAYTKANLFGTRLGGTTPPPAANAAANAAAAANTAAANAASGSNVGARGIAIDTSAADAALGTNTAPGGVPAGVAASSASSTDAANTGAGTGAQTVSDNMEVNQANIDALRNTALLPISANVDAALGGRYVGDAASVSNNGTAGMKTLNQINPASGNYAKINPVVYRNLDPTSQGQYNSLALANQGIDKSSLQKTIAGQLGGSSGGVPAAFRLR